VEQHDGGEIRDGGGIRDGGEIRDGGGIRDGDEIEVGVGPWQGAWPDDSRLDPQLLAGGDRRNVVDRYRYWRREAIVADLDRRRHEFHVAIENWQHDMNIGTVVRNANAFLAAQVHIVGRRRWNRRGAMVTDRYQHVRYHDTVEGFAAFARDAGMVVVGIDNLPGSRPLESVTLPRRCALLFGQEGPGLSDAARRACDLLFSIAQYGSTRSINAGVASGIAMHAWIRAHAGPPPGQPPGGGPGPAPPPPADRCDEV
jgi:tRNA(Leu) C34 or U34 (ribose-2'-O)-methylase TrmL